MYIPHGFYCKFSINSHTGVNEVPAYIYQIPHWIPIQADDQATFDLISKEVWPIYYMHNSGNYRNYTLEGLH